MIQLYTISYTHWLLRLQSRSFQVIHNVNSWPAGKVNVTNLLTVSSQYAVNTQALPSHIHTAQYYYCTPCVKIVFLSLSLIGQ